MSCRCCRGARCSRRECRLCWAPRGKPWHHTAQPEETTSASWAAGPSSPTSTLTWLSLPSYNPTHSMSLFLQADTKVILFRIFFFRIYFLFVMWKLIMRRREVIDVPIPWIIFIVRPVLAIRPSSETKNLRGRYHTILGYDMLFPKREFIRIIG